MPRHPRTASRGEQLKDSVFQALVRRASTHDGPVFPLHVGDSWREPPPAARAEALVTETHPGLHRYALPQGEPALLDAIVERLGVHAPVERKQVQVVSGATVGLSITCQALLDPGDEVLLPSPYWPLIRGIIASASATPVEIPFFTRLDEDDLDAEALLEAAVTERTTAIYLNSPHNPTGHVPSEAVLSAIARVAERHDLWVFCDEVYERLCYLDPQPAPTWSRDDLRHRAVATHSVSKSHALAGARVGWTHGPEEAMSALRKVQAHQVYCASRPMQAAALAALTEGESWLSE
ncbi:MAG: pyridoxal phosphate-dependent aminotransferase, partial [Acidobacteriota bacterium]